MAELLVKCFDALASAPLVAAMRHNGYQVEVLDKPNSEIVTVDFVREFCSGVDLIVLPLTLPGVDSLRMAEWIHLLRLRTKTCLFTASSQANDDNIKPLFDFLIEKTGFDISSAMDNFDRYIEQKAFNQPRIETLSGEKLYSKIQVLLNSLSCFHFDHFSGRHPELRYRITLEQYKSGVSTRILYSSWYGDRGKNIEIVNGNFVLSNDTYNFTSAGSVGPGSKAEVHGSSISGNTEPINKYELLGQLDQLRRTIMLVKDAKDQDLITQTLANAEIALIKDDPKSFLEYLKSAGKWSLEIAEKIGVNIASAALKEALGIK